MCVTQQVDGKQSAIRVPHSNEAHVTVQAAPVSWGPLAQSVTLTGHGVSRSWAHMGLAHWPKPVLLQLCRALTAQADGSIDCIACVGAVWRGCGHLDTSMIFDRLIPP